MSLHEVVVRDFLQFVPYREIHGIQMQISMRKGGLGLRQPRLFRNASRLSYLHGSVDNVSEYFKFRKWNEMSLEEKAKQQYPTTIQTLYEKQRERHRDEYRLMKGKFQRYLGTGIELVMTPKTTHRNLLDLMDKKLISEFMKRATISDKARFLSVGTTGVMGVFNQPPNKWFGIKLSNPETRMWRCYILGAKLMMTAKICKKERCDKVCDEYGIHAVSCPVAHHQIAGHNTLRDVLAGLCKAAGYRVEIEKRFKEHKHHRNHYGAEQDGNGGENDGNDRGNDHGSDRTVIFQEEEIAVPGIPGDVKVYGWWNRETKCDAYMDVTIVNPLAKSHVKAASKTRLSTATKREIAKRRYYKNVAEFIPCAVESYGAIGNPFKEVLGKLAETIGMKRCIPTSVIMQWVRARIVAAVVRSMLDRMLSSMTFE